MNITLKKDGKLEFENPVDISYSTAKRLNAGSFIDGAEIAVSNLQIIYHDSSGNSKDAYIISGINTSGDIKSGLNVKT